MTHLSHRLVPMTGLALATSLALTACGSGATTGGGQAVSTPASTTGGASGASGGQTGGQGGGRQPGVAGLVAAVSGSTMQVQTRTDQTAVSWTGATTFSRSVPAALSDVTTGECITVLRLQADASAGGAATPPTVVSAAAVQVASPVNGTCAGGAGGGARASGADTRTATPTPGLDATGPAGARGGRGFGVTGLVTGVSGSSFSVQEMARPGSTATPPAAAVTVSTSSTTTYLKQAVATAADLTVGECATATGPADSTGSVTATSIALRPAINGSCTTGAGGRGAAPAGTATTGSGVQ